MHIDNHRMFMRFSIFRCGEWCLINLLKKLTATAFTVGSETATGFLRKLYLTSHRSKVHRTCWLPRSLRPETYKYSPRTLMTGFSFERVGTAPPTSCSRGATKTGTTICGLVFPGGVVLGADTRSTNGETVADKNCAKIHYVAPNIYCCGAGTAADTEAVTGEWLSR